MNLNRLGCVRNLSWETIREVVEIEQVRDDDKRGQEINGFQNTFWKYI